MSIASSVLPQPLAPLAAWHQWILWRPVPHSKKPGKTIKKPVSYQTGITCDPTDPANHCTYPDAIAAAARFPGTFPGFVLTDDDPFWFVDIDAAFDGRAWSPLATQFYQALSTCAVETSQSNTGLHIIGSGRLADHGCKNIPLNLELYHTDRFIALTGACYDGGSAAAQPPAIHQIAAHYFPPSLAIARDDSWRTEAVDEWRGPDDDNELISRALRSKTAAAVFGQGVTFKHLWEADADALAKRWPADSGEGYDRSSADAALASMLAWWTGNNHERIDAIMRRSALARDKWDRSSAYLEPTILRASSIVTGCYQEPADLPPPPPITVPPLGHVSPSVPTIGGQDEPPAGDAPTTGGRVLTLTTQQAKDKNDSLTIEYWITAIGQRGAYDEFSDTVIMPDGSPLTDDRMTKHWLQAREVSGLKFPKELFRDVARNVALAHSFHPVRDYLVDCESQWDGTARIDSWMTDYLGVPPSPYSAAVGRLWLTAACRRIREPGAKFDEMPVLEGPQGTLKSTAIAMLVPDPKWFTDALTLNMDAKQVLEITLGKWLIESPEMSGMTKRDVEHVKSLLSRQTDRSRMAFGRITEERGRQWVAFGTTNAEKYLSDPTGNRRFWPQRTTAINLAGIVQARTQLWAEAARAERAGASIRLDAALWAAAGAEQAERVVDNPLQDELRALLLDRTGRVRGLTLLRAIGVNVERRHAFSRSLGEAMISLGWINKSVRTDAGPERFFVRGEPAREIIFAGGTMTYDETSLRAVSDRS